MFPPGKSGPAKSYSSRERWVETRSSQIPLASGTVIVIVDGIELEGQLQERGNAYIDLTPLALTINDAVATGSSILGESVVHSSGGCVRSKFALGLEVVRTLQWARD